jgi:spore cortex formation protein SpoVR/YcgB (stage V sporulation)
MNHIFFQYEYVAKTTQQPNVTFYIPQIYTTVTSSRALRQWQREITRIVRNS